MRFHHQPIGLLHQQNLNQSLHHHSNHNGNYPINDNGNIQHQIIETNGIGLSHQSPQSNNVTRTTGILSNQLPTDDVSTDLITRNLSFFNSENNTRTNNTTTINTDNNFDELSNTPSECILNYNYNNNNNNNNNNFNHNINERYLKLHQHQQEQQRNNWNNQTQLNDENFSKLISSVYGSNQHNTNFGRRENLIKLDLDTNSVRNFHGKNANTIMNDNDNRHLITNRNDNDKLSSSSSSNYSSIQSTPIDDNYIDDVDIVDGTVDDHDIEIPDSIQQNEEHEIDDVDEEEGELSHSSYGSFHSPEPTNFTRGIINPNYPGFQHLAHTLSEHFNDHNFDQNSTNSDESDDVSDEFEIDLIGNNFDNNNNTDDNNNNNDNDNSDDNNDSKLDNNNVNNKIETNKNLLLEIEPKIFCEKIILNDENNEVHEVADNVNEDSLNRRLNHDENLTLLDENNIKIKNNIYSINNINNDKITNKEMSNQDELCDQEATTNKMITQRTDDNNTIVDAQNDRNTIITCNLETYLKQYETPNDLKTTISPSEDGDSTCMDEIIKSHRVTPDILIKNDVADVDYLNTATEQLHKKNDLSAGKPDLLSNIESNIIENVIITTASPSPPPSAEQIIPLPPPQLPYNSLVVCPTRKINYKISKQYFIPKPPPLPSYSYVLRSPSSLSLPFETQLKMKIQENYDKILNQKQQFNNSTSPLDIVGDFGREIEREIGLIVSGYKNKQQSLHVQNNDDSGNMENSKMSDAELSNAKEIISLNTHSNTNYNNPSSNNNNLREITITTTSTVTPILSTEVTTKSDDFSCVMTLNRDTSLSSLSSSTYKQNCSIPTSYLGGNHRTISLSDTKKLLNLDLNTSKLRDKQQQHRLAGVPTAIVKPKYQKSLPEDRLIPPIGIDREKLLHNYDRRTVASGKTKSPATLFGLTTIGVANRKKSMSSKYMHEKDNIESNAAIAIVQPRKKDKMDNYNLTEKSKKIKSSLTKLGLSDNHLNNNINNDTSTMIYDDHQKIKKTANNNYISNLSSDHPASYLKDSIVIASGATSKMMNDLGGNNLDKESRKSSSTKKKIKDVSANFDVYNIETALPVIDLEAIENHLRAAKEEERRRRNDREEIRRRLAMGNEDDYYRSSVNEKPARKPSLQSRLQNGMNLQICFMNETASDNESTDSDTCPTLTSKPSSITSLSSLSSDYQSNNPYHSRPLSVNKSSSNYSNHYNGNSVGVAATASVPHKSSHQKQKPLRPDSLSLAPVPDENTNDFFTKQAKLQIEARMALSQAKDMARMQMEVERQKLKQSPITEVIRNALEKVGVSFPPDKRRLSRQLLTGMNIAQLQVIVNDLHTQIEYLNEHLMQFLMERDELRMSQDSMLVDIEDLTIYLGGKEETSYNKVKSSPPPLSSSLSATSLQTKPTSQQKLMPSSATSLGGGGHGGSNYQHNQQPPLQQPHLGKTTRSDSTSSIGSQHSIISTGSNNSQSLQNKFFKMANLVRK